MMSWNRWNEFRQLAPQHKTNRFFFSILQHDRTIRRYRTDTPVWCRTCPRRYASDQCVEYCEVFEFRAGIRRTPNSRGMRRLKRVDGGISLPRTEQRHRVGVRSVRNGEWDGGVGGGDGEEKRREVEPEDRMASLRGKGGWLMRREKIGGADLILGRSGWGGGRTWRWRPGRRPLR